MGWTDDTVNNKVIVAYTLYGDANLDGTVNGADLNIVLANYNKTGSIWYQGDFNYDGTVNGADLNIVLANYNQHLSVRRPPCPSRARWACWPSAPLPCWPGTAGGSESRSRNSWGGGSAALPGIRPLAAQTVVSGRVLFLGRPTFRTHIFRSRDVKIIGGRYALALGMLAFAKVPMAPPTLGFVAWMIVCRARWIVL